MEHISDEKNPSFIFNMTDTELLLKIALGKIDAKELAIKELVNRGLNPKGKWVGFKTAKEVWS